MPDSEEARILYMEDDPAQARAVVAVLERMGYEVDVAEDGEEGLAKYTSSSHDVVIIDHKMPLRSGLDVIRAMTTLGPLPPTIMITGNGDEKTAVEVMKLGVSDYLVKDMAGNFLDHLSTSIDRALTRKRLALAKQRMEDALRESRNELALRNRVAEIFLTHDDESVYDETLRLIMEAMESPLGILGCYDEDRDALVFFPLSRMALQQCQTSDKTVVLPRSSWEQSTWTRTFQEQAVLFANEPSRVPAGHLPIERHVSVPIVHQGRSIGLIQVANRETDYGENDARRMQMLANYIAPILGAQLQRDRQERSRQKAEAALRKRTRELGERVKELTCLHGISKILEERGLASENIIQKILPLIPPALRYPEITCVRIILDGKVYQTKDFQETLWKLGLPIHVRGRLAGALEACYRERRPEAEVGPFLREEKALIQEITERLGNVLGRNEAEREAADLKQRIEFVLGATKTGLHIVDSNHRIRYVDPESRRIYGDPDGIHCHEYFKGDNQPCEDCLHPRPHKTGSLRVTNDTLPKEHNRPVQRTAIPFQDKNGQWLVAQVVVDMTERRRIEAELARAQKLEAIGQLAAGIAHEINTPSQYIGDNMRFLQDAFADIGGLLEMLKTLLETAKKGPVDKQTIAKIENALEEADLDYLQEETPKAVQQSLDGIGKVSHIVHAMKEFSHPGGQEKQLVDLHRAIENILTISRNEWKYHADVVTEFAPDLPLVPCLPNELNQAVLNLVVNAAQTIAEKNLHDEAQRGTITIQTRYDEDWCEIRIQDTGAGIPEKIRSRVFDHFFTTKEVGKGTGQGLSIAYAVVVEKHGGTIDFESEEGVGTTFVIRLPMAEKETREENPEIQAGETQDEAYSVAGR